MPFDYAQVEQKKTEVNDSICLESQSKILSKLKTADVLDLEVK